ncbi:MAG: YbbR-like domain-containing protein [Fidelibacterota bacterium]
MARLASLRNVVEVGNLRIWVGATFFAAILWLFVISEHQYTYVIEIPIQIRNIKEGKTLRGETPLTAQVRFRGTGRALLKALLLKSISDFKLVLDLERISTQYDFHLNDYYERYSQNVIIPKGFELEFIDVVEPLTVHIDLTDYMIKPVRVLPNIVANPAPGFVQVGSISIDPETIELKGPKEIIRQVDTVQTEFAEFPSLEGPVDITLPVNLDFPRVVEASPPSIRVQVNIQEIGERIISGVPVIIRNKPEGIRVFANPSTVSLAVTGGVDYIAGLQSSDVEVFLDFRAQWEKEQLYYTPTVRVPPDVMKWRDLSPNTIELVVARITE